MKFQIIYRRVIWTDGYDSFEEALEDMNSHIETAKKNNKPEYGEKYFSIEVMIERDIKRQNGVKDTRATIEELAKGYMDKEYKEALDTIEKIKTLLNPHY